MDGDFTFNLSSVAVTGGRLLDLAILFVEAEGRDKRKDEQKQQHSADIFCHDGECKSLSGHAAAPSVSSPASAPPGLREGDQVKAGHH